MKKYLMLFTFLFSLLLYSCNSNLPEKDSESYAFVHTVFFWLNDSVTNSDKENFEAGMEELGKVPVIVKYDYGKPAGIERDVVDSSYDYAWIVYFKNAADHDVYQDHPFHLTFIENYRHLWKQVKVYDTMIE